jgi:hypothetical protein
MVANNVKRLKKLFLISVQLAVAAASTPLEPPAVSAGGIAAVNQPIGATIPSDGNGPASSSAVPEVRAAAASNDAGYETDAVKGPKLNVVYLDAMQEGDKLLAIHEATKDGAVLILTPTPALKRNLFAYLSAYPDVFTFKFEIQVVGEDPISVSVVQSVRDGVAWASKVVGSSPDTFLYHFDRSRFDIAGLKQAGLEIMDVITMSIKGGQLSLWSQSNGLLPPIEIHSVEEQMVAIDYYNQQL